MTRHILPFALALATSSVVFAQGDAEPAAEDATAEGETAPVGAAPVETAEEFVGDAVFDEGLEKFRAGDFAGAAENLWRYIDGNEPEADHYEWAEYYLARSFTELGLVHVGVEYFYNVAKERKRPELLPEALREIERVMATRPFDRELIIDDLLGSTDFGALPPDVQAFVAYQKGRRDLLDGRLSWAKRNFDTLERLRSENNLAVRYIARARFASALTEIRATHSRDTKSKQERRLAARKILEEIVASDVDDAETRAESAKVVARLYFEENRFDDALAMYEKIDAPFLSEEEASLFLEKAWTMHFADDPRGALGILQSLEAPAYRRYFFPEAFVLKALAYQSLCHYAAAKGAAREFLQRYGDAILELRKSRDPLAHPVLQRAAVQTKRPRRTLAFLQSLQREREGVERLPKNVRAQAATIYAAKIAEISRELELVVKAAGDKVAGELLDYEEQARLVDYEVSLEVFRRLKKGTGAKVAYDQDKPIPLGSKKVFYTFDVEYWNDELHNYRFRVENRCFGGELFR